MTAYGSECFTMNEVNRLKILQDVIDLTPRAAIWSSTVSRWHSTATKPAFFVLTTKMRLAVTDRRSSGAR